MNNKWRDYNFASP